MPIVTIRVTCKGTKPGATSVTVEETAALIKGTGQLLSADSCRWSAR
jgi:4-oxalocrotonate tautomerase